MKSKLKAFLAKKGWFLRKTAGISVGIDIFLDLKNRFGIDVFNIVDVGAHHGETIAEFKFHYPNSKIYAFEPILQNFEILKEKQPHWKDVFIEHFALSSTKGKTRLVLQKNSQTNSLQHTTDGAFNSNKTEEVEITTLDHYLEEKGIENIDLLKIDVEGFEIQVLQGSGKTLAGNKIKMILTEASLEYNDKNHTHLKDIQDFLIAYQFNLVGIYDQAFFDNPKKLGYFNALFIAQK